jgi:hypothetical protein
MTKVFIIAFLSITCILVTNDASGQNIADAFLQFEPESVLGFSVEQRHELLRTGNHRESDDTGLEMVLFELKRSSRCQGELDILMTFETGQRGFAHVALSQWKRDDGKWIYLRSRLGGTPAAVDVADLRFYEWESGSLRESEQLIPDAMDIGAYLKPGTPNDLRNEIEAFTTFLFEGCGEAGYPSWRMRGDALTDTQREWILTEEIEYEWNGEAFIPRHVSLTP